MSLPELIIPNLTRAAAQPRKSVNPPSVIICKLIYEIHLRPEQFLNHSVRISSKASFTFHVTAGVARTMLSARGADWAKVGFLHGKQDAYNPIHNPDGPVRFTNAENVS